MAPSFSAPSTDRPWKKKPPQRSLRRRSENTPGKQPGEEGAKSFTPAAQPHEKSRLAA